MTIIDTRRTNALQLAAQVGGQQKFADRLDMSRQQASHLIGKTRTKGIGHAMARRIEEVFEVPIGWLDADHSNKSQASADTLSVPLLDTAASVGNGLIQADDEVVRMIVFQKSWLKQNIIASAFEHLALLTAKGDSMEPTFTDGSILMVDRGISSIKLDAVYVLSRGGELFVKRIQRSLAGGYTVISDNPLYASITISEDERSHLMVLGRVVMVWNGKKL